MKGNRNYTVVVFLEIDTEIGKTKGAGNPFQYFTTRTEKAPLLRTRRPGPRSNRKVRPRGLARGGRRTNLDVGLHCIL